jgi:hypothetical protein
MWRLYMVLPSGLDIYLPTSSLIAAALFQAITPWVEIFVY